MTHVAARSDGIVGVRGFLKVGRQKRLAEGASKRLAYVAAQKQTPETLWPVWVTMLVRMDERTSFHLNWFRGSKKDLLEKAVILHR